MWNLDNLSLKKTLEGHSDWVTSVLKLDDNTLVSSSRDNTIKVWDINSLSLIGTLKGHTMGIETSLKFNKNIIISGSMDSTIKIWSFSEFFEEALNFYIQKNNKV